MSAAPKIELSNGLELPLLGFGVFQMSDDDTEQSVADAIEVGYRLIDTATSYMNEEAVGRGIAKSGIPREELFLTSKLWVTQATYEGAKAGYQRSLDKLGLDYLDLYLLHQPFGDVYAAWRALEEIYEAGGVKAIGVSNFNTARLMDFIIGNNITPMVNQIETHPFHQQNVAHELMAAEGIVHQGWAPFAEGKEGLFTNEVLASIGARYGKSVGQVVLRWNVQRGVAAIPKSIRKERIAENFDIFDFELDQSDLDQIAGLNRDLPLFVNHDDPNFVKMLFSRELPD